MIYLTGYNCITDRSEEIVDECLDHHPSAEVLDPTRVDKTDIPI